jgi:phage terminase large subunit-like protein
VIYEARRFNVLACGRRFGKTTLGLDRLIPPALDGQPVAYFAPTYKMLSEFWRAAQQTLKPVTRRVNVQEHRLELITGGVVDMWSLDSPDGPRGRKYRLAIVDEAAMVAHLGEAWQQVIRPTLADLEGGTWFLSTPRGFNFFRKVYGYGQSDAHPDWMSWQMPTMANPHIKPEEIQAMGRDMTERQYAQEILATFLDDGGGVFRNVQAAATIPMEPMLEREDGHQYIIGADWARSGDYSVFIVLDATARRMVDMDRFTNVEYTHQRQRLQALAEQWKPAAIISEENSMGGPVTEQLQRDGLPVRAFTTTNATKAAIIDSLALAFERQTLEILDDPTLIEELQAYQAERLPSGLTRYSAPEDKHDDCVMALALAWYGADRPSVDRLVDYV